MTDEALPLDTDTTPPLDEHPASGQAADETAVAATDAGGGAGYDIARVAELMSAKALGADDLKVKRLFDLISKGALDQDIYEAVVHGTVYFVDEEGGADAVAEELRLRFKCDLRTFPSGTALIHAVRASLPGLVLLGANAPGLDASAVLPEFLVAAFGRDTVPVVLFSADESWRTAFETLTYPRLTFVSRARGADGLLEAMGQHLTVDRTEAAIVEDTTIKEQIGLAKAQAIQENLLPDTIPSMPGLRIATYYEPCQEVGGDYYDFLPLPDGRLGVVCADVSGKGVGAAMVMVMFRSILRLAARAGASPRDVIIETNGQVTRDMLQGMFVSAIYLVIDPKTGRVELTNAGHMPLVHWPADQPRPVEVPLKGMVVGLAAGKRFERAAQQGHLDVRPGELLCLYTDGVVEAENADRGQYGDERLFEAIRRAGHDAAPQQVVDLVMADVAAFVGGAPQHDDTTLIILKAG